MNVTCVTMAPIHHRANGSPFFCCGQIDQRVIDWNREGCADKGRLGDEIRVTGGTGIEGYASVFGKCDQGGDVVEKESSLTNSGLPVSLLLLLCLVF